MILPTALAASALLAVLSQRSARSWLSPPALFGILWTGTALVSWAAWPELATPLSRAYLFISTSYAALAIGALLATERHRRSLRNVAPQALRRLPELRLTVVSNYVALTLGTLSAALFPVTERVGLGPIPGSRWPTFGNPCLTLDERSRHGGHSGVEEQHGGLGLTLYRVQAGGLRPTAVDLRR